MKKYLAVFMAFAAACALCLGLVGCGGSDSDKPDPAKYAGTWELTAMVVDGEESDSADIELMKSLGMSVNLELKADMTASLNMFGEVMTGTWSIKGENELEFMLGDAGGTAAVDGDSLTMTEGKTVLTFKRVEQTEAAEASASASASASAAVPAESSSAAASDAAASDAAADDATADEAADETADEEAVDEEEAE